MKLTILHVVGGHHTGGAFKGAYILHKSLKKLNLNSIIINDDLSNKKNIFDKDFYYINNNIYSRFLCYLYKLLAKAIKLIFLGQTRHSFTLGLFGFDITKTDVYQKADIIHFHWFGDGFIDMKSLNKINKPVVWTMRDMWCFTGGPHYISDHRNNYKIFLVKLLEEQKKKIFKKKIQFIAISEWLKKKAQSSYILKNANVIKIYNNVDSSKFKPIKKSQARSKLKIFTKKKIILFGAENPQNLRKGWDILIDTIKRINKDDYYLVIFGKFWSEKIISETGIEYKNFGYVSDKKKLSFIYSAADIFLAISNEEAFGKTWAEAMLCNTPVICFKNSSTSEIIKHKYNGYICSKKNSENVLIGLEWMKNSKKKIIKKNLRKFCKIFEPKIIAKEYFTIYKNLFK